MAERMDAVSLILQEALVDSLTQRIPLVGYSLLGKLNLVLLTCLYHICLHDLLYDFFDLLVSSIVCVASLQHLGTHR